MLKPFNFWCQKVLPLVFDDSLSYYEVLCKLKNKVNELIMFINENIGNMIEAWINEHPDELNIKVLPLYGKKILIVADSLMAVSRWKDYLVTEHGAKSVDVINAGTYGYASSNEGVDNTIVQMLSGESDIYDYILLAIGQFDYIRQEEIGQYGDYGDAEKRMVFAGAGKIINYCNMHFPSAEVFVMSPISNGVAIASIGQYAGGGQYKAIGQPAYNLALARISKHYGARFIDGSYTPFCAPWQTTLRNKWYDVSYAEPYWCVPNTDFAPHLAKYIANGLATNDYIVPNITDAMVFGHPNNEAEHTVRYEVNRHSEHIRIKCPFTAASGWVVVSDFPWKFLEPIAATYCLGLAAPKSGAPVQVVISLSQTNGIRVAATGLTAGDTYMLYADVTVQNNIGAQGG